MNIDIIAVTKHIAEQSDDNSHRYVFAYTITIKNNSDETVQLLNRYWLITDANDKKIEVKGAGVVGEQPNIDPGEEYSYTSGCILETEVGTMEGHYEFQCLNGEKVIQPIDVFRLSVPNIVH